jgi:NO-binding membrane sensor protein with MHYT domain
MFAFASGLIAMGFTVSALFFLRYWRQTRDVLFAAFSAAFVLLALNQTLLAFTSMPVEERSPIYLLRLAAFALIAAAIVAKNRRGQ